MRKTRTQSWIGLAWCAGAFVFVTHRVEAQRLVILPWRYEFLSPRAPPPLSDGFTSFTKSICRISGRRMFESNSWTCLAATVARSRAGRIPGCGSACRSSAVRRRAVPCRCWRPGSRAIAYLWVTLLPAQPVPSELIHRLTFSHGTEHRDTLMTAPVAVMARGPVLAAPVRGGPWIAARGPFEQLSPSSVDCGVGRRRPSPAAIRG